MILFRYLQVGYAPVSKCSLALEFWSGRIVELR